MLTFSINRAGKALPKTRRARLEQAKDGLRALYRKPPRRKRARAGMSQLRFYPYIRQT